MAVATESFSIREYTARMRSIDLRRCWPFDGGSEAGPLLPPISVRRFKWWTDEVASARSKVIVEEEGDPSKYVVAAAISEAEVLETSAAPIAGEEVRRAVKGKQRTPKKRSIVELFATAPLVAGTVDFDEAYSDEGERWEEGDAVEEGEIDLVMRKKKSMKENIIKNKKRRKKKKKNKGIKDGLKLEICAWEKEKICKPKMLSSVQSCMSQNPVFSNKSKKADRSFVESQKHPAREKAVRKKHKVLRTSVLLSRNQEVAKKPPVRSILKHHNRGTTDRKSSKSVDDKAANLIKFYCKSNKHVTFSVKYDILGNSIPRPSMDFPQLQNLCKIFSDVLAASSTSNHSTKSIDLPDTNDNPQEGTYSSVVSRIEASSTDKNQSSDSIVNLCQPTLVNSSNSSCSGTEKASFALMVDLNHAVDANDIDCGIPVTSTVSTSCIYSGDPNLRVTLHEKNLNSTSDIHLEAALPSPSEPSLVLASSNVTSSMTLLNNPSSTSSLIAYDKANDADVNFYRQIEEHQSGGKDNNKCYSMGSKKLGEYLFNPNSVPTCKTKRPGDQDFIGLPLNSQGELIQFHSGTKFSEAYNKQNIELGNSHGFSANRYAESNNRMNHLEMLRKKIAGAASYQKNQSDWNKKHCYSTKERVRHWLNFAELEGSERLETQKNKPVKGKDIFLHCNSTPRSPSFPDYHHSQPDVQPTMRLMGKNVVLSGINRDCKAFNDGRTWNNNEIPLSHPTIANRSEGNLLDLLDSTPNFYRMKALEPPLDHINITQQPPWPSRSTQATQFLGNCVPGEGSVRTRQQILLSPSHYCKHNQRDSKYQDFGKLSQPPLLQPASKLPQWLLHAKHQKRTQLSDPTAISQPCHVPAATSSNYLLSPLVSNRNIIIKKKERDAQKLVKRPADFDHGMINSAKRPLKGQVDEPKKMIDNPERTDKAKPNEKDLCRKFDSESRSGPAKLIAGAKHILKPCQRIDEVNCRPIHSIIVPAITEASGKLFGSEKKISNIYNF